MNKEELGEKITVFLKDEDKELARETFLDIRNYIANFYIHDINLKALYDGLKCSHLHSPTEAYFMFRNVKLLFRNKGNDIQVLQVSPEQDDQILDVITATNGRVTCKHGEFTLKEVDKYLSECFSDLVD